MVQTPWCLTSGEVSQTVRGLHEQQDDVQGRYIQADQSLQKPFLTAFSSTPAPPVSTVAAPTPPVLPVPPPFGSSLSMDSIIASGGSESARDSATNLPRASGSRVTTDMAIDPRWNAELPENKTQYFQSIAKELDNSEIRFMPDPHAPAALPMVGGSRNASDHEDAKPSAGRRSSMLKSRIKHSKTPPRAAASARQQSVTDTTIPRTPSSSSISATTSVSRRPSVPVPPVPGGSRSTSSGLDRQRSISMTTSTVPPASHPSRLPLPPPLTMPAGFATAVPPSTAPEPADGDWIGIAFVGAKGSGKSVAIRKTIKHQTTRDHRRLRYNGYESMSLYFSAVRPTNVP